MEAILTFVFQHPIVFTFLYLLAAAVAVAV
jgi:hypothetical protein